MATSYDVAVVGSGPNGLAAAIVLAQRGRSVVVMEAQPTVGGGARSAELTRPNFVHDVCSAIHPMAMASPLFRTLPLERFGLKWIHPPAAIAHPSDDEPAVIVESSIEKTAATLAADETRYRHLVRPLVELAPRLFDDLLAPLHLPRHPLALMRFAWHASRSASGLAERWFTGERGRAMFAGLAAHSILPMERAPSAAVGLVLLIAAHAVGWPIPQGGSQAISDALAQHFRSLGGEVVTGRRITNVSELSEARLIMLDLTPRQVLQVAGHQLTARERRSLRKYRYGPGVFKVDWALNRPIPWKDPACARAGTVHLGGTFEEIAEGEASVWNGSPARRPFVLLAQPSLFDPSRAPSGDHTAWGYCHVPHGSDFDMLSRIEAQVDRFAPGFRECVLARHVLSPVQLEEYNANYIGGDINGGVQDFGQLMTRPFFRWRPYRTAGRRIYLCSSSTPPGGGVHGMCGYYAAQTVLDDHFH